MHGTLFWDVKHRVSRLKVSLVLVKRVMVRCVATKSFEFMGDGRRLCVVRCDLSLSKSIK